MREQLAWAAGLFEGEGCWALCRGGGGNPNMRQVRAQLEISDADVINRFATIIGVGLIRVPSRRPNRKQTYCWRVTSFEGFQYTAALFWGWLGERRKAKVRELLLAMREYHARGYPQRGTRRKSS